MRFRTSITAVLAVALAVPLALVAPTAPAGAVQTSEMAAAAPIGAALPAGVTRLSGASRYETAIAVSKRYAPGPKAVFVATGTDFPDALAAASAAAFLGGPLLLTPPSQLPAAVAAEVRRLKPDKIYVVGGAAVVSESVRTSLNQIAPTTRLWGVDRIATGLKVVAEVFPSAGHAIIATARAFPDALAASGAAGSRKAPVILVDGGNSTLSAATLSALTRLKVTSVSIAGATGAVSAGIQSHLTRSGYEVTRYGGASRYETAALINQSYFPAGSAATSFLATGVDFPDALAGAALAGHVAAPLNVTPRTCMHPDVSDGINQLAAANRVALGGTAVVSDAAAANARCVFPVTNEPLADWALSNWTLARDIGAPYGDRPPVNVNDTSIKLDETGLRIYLRIDNGQRADHPVAYAQYGISALIEYDRTGKKEWLDRAKRHGQRLAQIHTTRGEAWWFPYPFPWTYYGRSLGTPWWSAMAQGQALSLFVRLAEVTAEEEPGDVDWDKAADATWKSFGQAYSTTAPWSSLVIDDHLYFEEYAGKQVPLLVLNGHAFALFGLYDYWKRTGNAEAAQYFDGGATTVLDRMMPLVRVEKGVSYYCVQAEYCQSPLWQNKPYHVIHSWQLDTLASITGDTRFTEWATVLRADWQPPVSGQRYAQPDTDRKVGTGGPEGWIEP